MKYSDLVNVYERLELTTKRLEKTYFISKLLKSCSKENLDKVILLLQGRLYPTWDERKIGMAAKTLLKPISLAAGVDLAKVEEEWKNTGDLGLAAEKVLSKKKQATLFSQPLTVSKVFNNLGKLSELTGQGTVARKGQLVSELLSNASAAESKFITRTVLEELRVGVGEGAVRDAIAWAFLPNVIGIFFKCEACDAWNPASPKCAECGSKLNTKFNDEIKKEHKGKILKVSGLEDVKSNKIDSFDFIQADDEKLARQIYDYIIGLIQSAYDVSNDFSVVALTAKEKGREGLQKISLKENVPIKVMLAQKIKDVDEAFEKVGVPAAIEYKLDGFRIQIHKHAGKVSLFTRRLEDVTKQFPEVVEYVKKHVKGSSFILDSEAVGFDPKTGKYTPFQHISQRIKRKYDIDMIAKKLPVELNVFDVISYEGKNMISVDFKSRRALLEKITDQVKKKIIVVKQLVTDDKKKAEGFYAESLAAGNEGVMFKSLDAPYKPGSRVGHMVKYKPVMESLDLVIVGAEWGEGKRSEWLSSFVLACQDPDSGEFLEVGKVGTGFKEKEEEGLTFQQMTDILKPLIISEKGKSVKIKPQIIIEVHYEEIQKSPKYSSGLALRFPRVIQLRGDRGPEDCSTIDMVEELFSEQKK